jgi:hypothetical protein
MNMTGNKADSISAVSITDSGGFSLRFCTLLQNGPKSCLYLSLETSDVSCLAVINNTCENHVDPGLIGVGSSMALKKFLAQANSFFVFISGARADTTVKFVDSIFDFVFPVGPGQIVPVTQNCTVGVADSVIGCGTATAIPPRTETGMQNRSLTPRESRSFSATEGPSRSEKATEERTQIPNATMSRCQDLFTTEAASFGRSPTSEGGVTPDRALGMPVWEPAVIATGGLVLLALGAALLVWCCIRRRRKQGEWHTASGGGLLAEAGLFRDM